MSGFEHLIRNGLFNPSTGMWANLRLRIVQADSDGTVVEGEVDAPAHGSGRDATIHRGAVSTIADCALASAATAVVDEGQSTVTVDLRVEFLRPAQPGEIAANARVVDRRQDLVFCEAMVEQKGLAIAHANAIIAVVAAS